MVELKADLSVQKQCELLNLNRSSYYYKSRPKEVAEQLRRALLEIHEIQPFYGYRKEVYSLKEKGFNVGKKLVQRLKRLFGLKTLYPQSKTSISNKAHRKYPYLLKDVPATHSNHVWSADISYIPVGRSHVYLVGIIDWYSRKLLSYRVSNTMDKQFCLDALEEALQTFGKPAIFNTDQGSQFTSRDFTGQLEANEIAISMDGKGRCLDNIFIERWFRSLKHEDIYLKEYQNVPEVKAGIADYVCFYNTKRIHASLEYKTPEQVYYADLAMRSSLGVKAA